MSPINNDPNPFHLQQPSMVRIGIDDDSIAGASCFFDPLHHHGSFFFMATMHMLDDTILRI